MRTTISTAGSHSMASGPRRRPSSGLSDPPVRTRQQTARVATQRTMASRASRRWRRRSRAWPTSTSAARSTEPPPSTALALPRGAPGLPGAAAGSPRSPVRLVLTDPCMPTRLPPFSEASDPAPAGPVSHADQGTYHRCGTSSRVLPTQAGRRTRQAYRGRMPASPAKPTSVGRAPRGAGRDRSTPRTRRSPGRGGRAASRRGPAHLPARSRRRPCGRWSARPSGGSTSPRWASPRDRPAAHQGGTARNGSDPVAASMQ